MLKMPLEEILAKIKEKSGMSEEELKEKIKQKMDQLAGLISKEGAAHIIANELGIKLFEQASGRLKINSTLSGMRNVEIVGRVMDVYEVREFQRGTRQGKVGSFLAGDESGRIRVVLWNEQADQLQNLEKNMVIKIQGAYIRDNNGRKELHLGDNGILVLNPDDEVVGEVKQRSFTRKNISELKENDNDIEILATIVQVYDIRFFEICPNCNKRAKQRITQTKTDETGQEKSEVVYVCDQHGDIKPDYSYVFNVYLDDGTGTTRAVFFKNQAQDLMEKSHEEILAIKEDPNKFEQIKHGLLGKIVLVKGRANKNAMFDRLEFVSQFVEPNPNPEEEIRKISQETEEPQAMQTMQAAESIEAPMMQAENKEEITKIESDLEKEDIPKLNQI